MCFNVHTYVHMTFAFFAEYENKWYILMYLRITVYAFIKILA